MRRSGRPPPPRLLRAGAAMSASEEARTSPSPSAVELNLRRLCAVTPLFTFVRFRCGFRGAISYGKLRRRELRAPSAMTFGQAATQWLLGARARVIRTRSGDVYKPSTIRSYELALRGSKRSGDGLLREFSQIKLSELTVEDVQTYADRLLAAGASPSTTPFSASSVSERALRAWKVADLQAICLHDCRHTFASLMIAAGVNAKALSTFMGHANISITLDRYGHLMPGAEGEAAGLMDAYLQAAHAAPTPSVAVTVG